MSNLKKTIVSMLAGLTISKHELFVLKKVFNKLDVDKNGRLSMQDLRNGLLNEETTRNSVTRNTVTRASFSSARSDGSI